MNVLDFDCDTLDFYVAKALGMSHPEYLREMAPGCCLIQNEFQDEDGNVTRWVAFRPSTNWAHSGSIIESAEICIYPLAHEKEDNHVAGWGSTIYYDGGERYDVEGDTALIAAMRAFVVSIFGEIIK